MRERFLPRLRHSRCLISSMPLDITGCYIRVANSQDKEAFTPERIPAPKKAGVHCDGNQRNECQSPERWYGVTTDKDLLQRTNPSCQGRQRLSIPKLTATRRCASPGSVEGYVSPTVPPWALTDIERRDVPNTRGVLRNHSKGDGSCESEDEALGLFARGQGTTWARVQGSNRERRGGRSGENKFLFQDVPFPQWDGEHHSCSHASNAEIGSGRDANTAAKMKLC